jgi:hypothetical protein
VCYIFLYNFTMKHFCCDKYVESYIFFEIHAETHVCLHAKYPLLCNFNQNWNGTINFSTTSNWQFTGKSVQWLLHVRQDEQREANRHIFATFHSECAKNEISGLGRKESRIQWEFLLNSWNMDVISANGRVKSH